MNQLFHRIADGEHAAFTLLVNQYWNALYSHAITYLKDSHKAQDVVQEIFLSIWNKRDKLAAVENPDNYVFIVARNRIVSELRKKLLEPITTVTEQIAAGPNQSPDQQLSNKHLLQLVDNAVNQLPPQQRTVFILGKTEGLKYEEIAAKLGLSKETVKRHMVKALGFIRTFVRLHAGKYTLFLLFRIFFSDK